MSVLKTDDFSGTDADPIGGIWSFPTGWAAGWKRVSNDAQPFSLGLDCAVYENTATWPNDQYSKAVLTSISTDSASGNGIGVAVRMATGSETGYEFVSATTGGSSLNKRNAGFTQLATSATAYVATDEIYIEGQGSNLVAKRNGTTFLSTSDSALASGKVGMVYSGGASSGTSAFANWEGGDFAGGGDTQEWMTRAAPEKSKRTVQQGY